MSAMDGYLNIKSVIQAERDLLDSDVPTAWLAALALTLPVVPGRNLLHGRSHAWNSIGHTQAAAIEFTLESSEDQQRSFCAHALAQAGHDLTTVRETAR